MARPRSEDKRNALMAAATRVIATHGLGAPTAMIAQEAGVANGSLFTYFETNSLSGKSLERLMQPLSACLGTFRIGCKADLLNQLYLDLKAGQTSAVLEGLPAGAELRAQVFHLWSQWMGWAASGPEMRRALAQLDVSDEITPASRAAAHQTMAGIADLLERSRANGPLRDAPLGFVVALMNALAEATMDAIIRDPANAEQRCTVGFEALWRVIA